MEGLEFRVQSLELGFMFQGSGSRVEDLGLRILGLVRL